jgi:hypothetical protein
VINVFLSASIPLPERDRRFFDTADVLSIREAIKALVEVVLPIGHITCGGHPAITPLLALFVREAGLDRSRITVYQSERFSRLIPAETLQFTDVRFTPDVPDDLGRSLTLMRERMLTDRSYDAAVIVGGMEGIFEELELFRRHNPSAPVLPIASTGAAAAEIYAAGQYPGYLLNDLTYASLFRRHLAVIARAD